MASEVQVSVKEPETPRLYAITGGIACGKSTVAGLFRQHGVAIYSADDDARAARAEPETQAAILAAFGTTDKDELSAIIFHDPDARRRLNAIVHPRVRARMREVLDAARADTTSGLVLYEVPLLYEGGLETWFDGVIAVVCAPEVQKARLFARSPLTEAEIEERLRAQMPAEEKARRADFTVRTDVPLEETEAQVRAIIRDISKTDISSKIA